MTRITRRCLLAAAGPGLAAQAPPRRNTTPVKLHSVFFEIAPSRDDTNLTPMTNPGDPGASVRGLSRG